MLTFYNFPKAPSPRRAEMVLIEKDISYDNVTVDLASGEHFGDAFRAINPSCTVPALKTGSGEVLTDNHGILAYLEATYPEPPLLGRTALEKAAVASWQARIEFEGLLAIAEALRNSAPAMKGRALTGPHSYEQIPALAERGVKRLGIFWEVLDQQLEGRDYVATNDFTAADILAVVAVDFAKIIRQSPRQHFANLWRWRESLHERPSVAKTAP
ncbi:MAG: glutathione S-transferase N-terminal domain-containing protein [Pseudomonadota bacterium]